MVPLRFLLVSKSVRNKNTKLYQEIVCYIPKPSIVELKLKEKKLYDSVN